MADDGKCPTCGDVRYWCRNLGCVEGLKLDDESVGDDQSFFFYEGPVLRRTTEVETPGP